MKRALLPLPLLLIAACGSPPEANNPPPQPSATPIRASTPPVPTPAPVASAKPYAGHGAESVPPEVLAKFAPTPIPSDVSRRIQAMLDVRAPIGSRMAPDGKALYFSWNVTGTAQVWKADGPRRFPIQLTGGEDVTRVSAILPDGKWLVVARDRKGEENPGLYLLSTGGSGAEPLTGGGAMKEIQHKAKVQTQLQFVSDDGKSIYFRANDVKADSYAIYKYDVASGKRDLVFGEDGLWEVDDHAPASWGAANAGKLLLAKATGALTKEYWEYDEGQKKLVPLFGQNEKEEYEAVYGSATNELLVLTPKFGDFRRLYKAKPKPKTDAKGGPLEQGETSAITGDIKHDVNGFITDRQKKNVFLSINEDGYTRAKWLDGKTYAEKPLPEMKGEDHVTFGVPSWDGRYVPINAGAAKHPTTSHVFDTQQNKLTQWVVPSTPEIDTSKFASPSLESYPARDGTKVPMFVRRPAQCVKPSEPCPVVVHFHGGPEGQSVAGFSTYGQIFVDAGFIWVEPNVRGSDGYGKTWLHADDGPKRLAVITDIEDAAKHVRATFAVNGKTPKVGVMGGSYGGYSTLVAMTKFAGAYDAGVANVGMSNLYSFLMNTAPYRRALRITEYGDPDKDKQALMELSPITYIDKVNAPLLLIQGATDPRVPVGEAIQMHGALEKKGNPTKMIVFPDEGHGTQKRENKVLEIGHTLDFFEVHLKGKKK